MPNSYQPESYDDLEFKLASRMRNVNYYRKLRGSSIPDGFGYWSLCGKQEDRFESEIRQLSDDGFIKKPQFFGISRKEEDKDNPGKTNIETNIEAHPDMPPSNWFEGEWKKCLHEACRLGVFKPAMVHFDSTAEAHTEELADNVAEAILLCRNFPGAVLFANMMVEKNNTNGRKINRDKFFANVVARAGSLLNGLEHYEFPPYMSNPAKKSSPMQTFVFYKKGS